MNPTTITGGEETLEVQAPDGKSGEGGRVTTLELGGVPSQGLIQAGHSLLSMVEGGLVPLDPGKLSFPDSPPYRQNHPSYSGIVQEVV